MNVLFPQTYNYKPFSTAGYVKGRFQSTYLDETTFIGNVQPATQEEINSLDIGRELRGTIKIYTDQVFNIAEEGTKTNGDIIIYEGKEYEVISLNNHTGTLLPHKKYFAELRINDDLG
jgi:hypothetical protein